MGVSEKAFMCGLENLRGTFVTGRPDELSFTSAETEEVIKEFRPTDRYNCTQISTNVLIFQKKKKHDVGCVKVTYTRSLTVHAKTDDSGAPVTKVK